MSDKELISDFEQLLIKKAKFIVTDPVLAKSPMYWIDFANHIAETLLNNGHNSTELQQTKNTLDKLTDNSLENSLKKAK